jgi:4-diphosphocytidyl-2C-methyl-D-erythritol kinase
VGAYKALDGTEREWRDFPEDLWSGHNDFALVAPQVSLKAVEWLSGKGAAASGLSGSGSAVWGLFDDEASAEVVAARAASLGSAWACRTLTREESLWTS